MNKGLKRNLTRFGLGLLVLLIVVVFCRSCIYQTTMEYKDAGGRKTYKVKDDKLAAYIDEYLPDEKLTNIETIVDLSLAITSNNLSFSLESKEKDPKKLYPTGEANCEGYAAFAAAVGNYLLDKYKMDDWDARPVKGKLYLFGSELTTKAKKSYFKNHDFVIFTNKQTKEEIYVDPSIHDYFKINRVSKYAK
ncbi:hypothetical protein [Dysgonomonas sp. ZJ709]|uniref:hypothetical protein n=1 Tax=Dysgonomonas sp. ZJ709 TaxID=2709797 RepID=UPI0013EB5689|nr:hypothetical protein [Dysgonomonas sp. ZJ709]